MNGTGRTVRLDTRQRRFLKALLKGQEASARERVRAQILLLSDKRWSRVDIAEATGASESTIGRVRRQFNEEGLRLTLSEKPRSGAPPKLTPRQEQQIVAVACSAPPQGFARWSLRLLTEEAHRRKVIETGSRELVRVVLHRHGLKPWREKNVVRTRAE
jgi:transposase